ncbi:MAG: pyridoxal phosphate-dependent aminotransferase [Planctomycetota bacterium]
MTLAISGKAKQMAAEGIDVISLSAGEPDFNVPEIIAKGVFQAIEERRNRYTPVPGIPELRKRLAEKFASENRLDYAPEEILVAAGAKHAIFNGLNALVNPGDVVLVPSPYWVSYPPQVALMGGKCAFIPCTLEEGYRLSPEAVESACTPETRILILNSPNNPTGAVYPEEDLARIAEIAVAKDLFVISDEIYEKLVYGTARHVCIASLHPGMRERTLTVNGFSKSWAMPGWRLGYCAGPKPLIDAMIKIQGHSTSNAPSLIQYAVLDALRSDGAPVEAMRIEFEKRRDLLCRRLDAVDGVTIHVPDGAFYILAGVADRLPATLDGREIRDGTALAMALLEIAHVATVPGEAFGAPGALRFSYAAAPEDLEKGVERFAAFTKRLQPL